MKGIEPLLKQGLLKQGIFISEDFSENVKVIMWGSSSHRH